VADPRSKRQRWLQDSGLVDRDGELTTKGQNLAEDLHNPPPKPELPDDDYHRFLAPDPFPGGGLV
jgi:hypothetical protein